MRLFSLSCLLLVVLLFPDSQTLGAMSLVEGENLLISGRYRECIKQCQAELKSSENEEWRLLWARAALMIGEYEDAETVINVLLQRNYGSIRSRLLAREIFFYRNKPERAREVLDEINQLGSNRMWAYRDPANLVTLGRAALLLGAEPKLVLQTFFDKAKQADATYRDTYLAMGELALQKNDFELAAKTYQDGLKKFPKDPDIHFGLARAFFPSDRSETRGWLEKTLQYNSNHAGAFLLLADHLIDSEGYEKAGEALDKALAVNPKHPEAWAYRAVIHHLANHPTEEQGARERALQHWKKNPRVDHLIGLKLSQKYRFAEGAERQKKALLYDSEYLPAKIQLAQDLLRLGQEKEGWEYAEEVHKQDAYDVVAYNLATLHDSLGKFKTLTNDSFILRMAPHEAGLYGERALKLLQKAKDELCPKYGVELPDKVIVEIFNSQKDFAVRTFGMPGNPGYLGVCFGLVVTANSPAATPGHPASWEAVLWHEFCHVVTLQKTRNRMPRWLSEGISVFEERQRSKAWGEKLTPQYRDMILKGGLTPISELSAAFLSPKSDHHLQFAYYESSLVVEFLVLKFGMDPLKKILHDLGEGEEIKPALEKNIGPLKELEEKFGQFARERAEGLGAGLSWEKPPEDLTEIDSIWKYSTNYWILQRAAKKALSEKNWDKAAEPLETLLKHYPENTEADSPYRLLARVHQARGKTNEEALLLEKLAVQDGAELEAYSRLMELAANKKDWAAVEKNAERFLGVNPLTPQPYRYLAMAGEATGASEKAIDSYRRILLLEPTNPAEIHFRLARLLEGSAKTEAKRHLLQALEEAPRFREAHELLLKMAEPKAALDQEKKP